ncbi:hypothetical protein F4556_001158 [Kitasatospora gansuensis]|uniref:Secreted protein/lipoprotein n=1 Tax=Kitasatospora gansuensis TaxID=258050 RepID=A0A7W7S9A2_9ACTN|nr:hypothetical protein [Kitasatospora gansuensis]MBB4945623.1 hypothetical protein [Kitasatospora gansuensis]
MRQRVITVRPGAVGAGGLTLLLLTSCGAADNGSSTDRLPDVTSAPTVPAVTPGGSAAVQNAPTEGADGAVGRVILRAYQGWWDARIAAFGQPEDDPAAVRGYATDQALSDTLVSRQQLREAKLVMVGTPRNSPLVKSIRLTDNPPSATVEDCVDVTDWHQADATTKALRDPAQRLTRYVATATLRKTDSRWLIVDFKREETRSC